MDKSLFVGAPDNAAIRELRDDVIRRHTLADAIQREAKALRLTRAILWTAIVMLTTATASLAFFPPTP